MFGFFLITFAKMVVDILIDVNTTFEGMFALCLVSSTVVRNR